MNWKRAARALVTKMELIQADPAWAGLWTLHFTHGGKWPQELNWKAEFDGLKALLEKEPT